MFLIIDRILKKPYIAILVTAVACFLMFSPAPKDDFEIPGFLDFLNDKMVHCIMFLGMSFLWKRYLYKVQLLPLFLFLFAILTEVIQYLLPESFSRSFEFNDILADSAGIVLGLFCSWLFDKILKR